MIVKPHLAILMPLLLARRGAWTAFASAALTVAGAVVVSGLLFGFEPWARFPGDTQLHEPARQDRRASDRRLSHDRSSGT